MLNNHLKIWGYTLLIVGSLFVTGCEVEQSGSKNNDAMVGYAQEQAKAEAELANQEQLKKSSLPASGIVKDGTTQSLNLKQ